MSGDVKPFAREVLQDIRYRGEETWKNWADPPKVCECDGTYVLTYGIENWIRTAVASRVDKAPFEIDAFLKAVPVFKEVFGEIIECQLYATQIRGVCVLMRFNDWRTDPFFPRDTQEAEQQ